MVSKVIVSVIILIAIAGIVFSLLFFTSGGVVTSSQADTLIELKGCSTLENCNNLLRQNGISEDKIASAQIICDAGTCKIKVSAPPPQVIEVNK